MPSSGSMIHSKPPLAPGWWPPSSARIEWSGNAPRIARDDRGLALTIGARDQVVLRLLLGAEVARAVEAGQDLAAGARGGDGDREQLLVHHW